MANPEHIEHRGRIESIEGGLVRVRIVANSACGTCVARQACGMSESTEKIIDVKVGTAEAFIVGEEVMVAVHRKVGLWAVAVAYVAPLIVLVAVLAVASAVGLNENIAALGSLGGVAVYYLLLWAFGGRVTQKVSFTISKI